MPFFTEAERTAHNAALNGTPQEQIDYAPVVAQIVREMIEDLQKQARYLFTSGQSDIRVVVASDRTSRDEHALYAPVGMIHNALMAELPRAFQVSLNQIKLVRVHYSGTGNLVPGTYDDGYRSLTVRVEFKEPLK